MAPSFIKAHDLSQVIQATLILKDLVELAAEQTARPQSNKSCPTASRWTCRLLSAS